MVDGAAAAVPPRQVDRRVSDERDVGLGPGVLVAADDDARVVAPQEQEVLENTDKRSS